MGAHNVKRALRAKGLSDPALQTLIVMALVSLDRDYGRRRALVYFGGHDGIIAARGLDVTPSRLPHLRYAVAELKAHGCVEPCGWVERHRVYRLHLPDLPVDKPVD